MEVSFPSIDAAPSWYAITQNGIICLATFGCAVLWFLLSGNGKKRITDADDYTRYFLANSLAYFAGWNTMSIVRQLVAVLCLEVELLLETHRHVVATVLGTWDDASLHQTADVLTVALFCPLFTYVVFLFERSVLTAIVARAKGVDAERAKKAAKRRVSKIEGQVLRARSKSPDKGQRRDELEDHLEGSRPRLARSTDSERSLV